MIPGCFFNLASMVPIIIIQATERENQLNKPTQLQQLWTSVIPIERYTKGWNKRYSPGGGDQQLSNSNKKEIMPGFDNLAILLGLEPLNLRKEYTIAKLLDQHNFTLLSKPYSYIHKKLTYHSSAKKVLFTVNGENSQKHVEISKLQGT